MLLVIHPFCIKNETKHKKEIFMIDWITAVLPCNHTLRNVKSGTLVFIGTNGIEWTTHTSIQVEGSFSNKIRIRSTGLHSIEISGNPAKFLQGHNIFGTDDLNKLMVRFFDELIKRHQHTLNLRPTPDQYQAIKNGRYKLSRVDINRTYLLQDKPSVLNWLRVAGNHANLRSRGRGTFSGETLYFGRNSKRWSLKFYHKGSEINARGHNLPQSLQYPKLMAWADLALRAEVSIKSTQLREWELNEAHQWTPDMPKLQLDRILCRLNIPETFALNDRLVAELRPALRTQYLLWRDGHDLKTISSKPTFYRNRKALLEYDIDISSPCALEENRVSASAVLMRPPAEIPKWAYGKGLVAR